MLLRASELQCELEEQTVQLHKRQADSDKLQHSLSEADLEVNTSKAAEQVAKKEAWALKGELKAHAEAAAKVMHHTCPVVYCEQAQATPLYILRGMLPLISANNDCGFAHLWMLLHWVDHLLLTQNIQTLWLVPQHTSTSSVRVCWPS